MVVFGLADSFTGIGGGSDTTTVGVGTFTSFEMEAGS